GEVGEFESGQEIPIEEPETFAEEADATIASGEQQKILMATAREKGWTDAQRYELTERICGDRSVKKVPKAKVDELLSGLNMGPQILESIRAADAAKAAEDGSDDIPLTGPPVEPGEDTRTNDQLIGELRAYGDALSIRQQVDAAISKHVDEREWLLR